MANKKVFVSGCYDLLHSGHIEFFQQAARFGDLYVGIGSDATYLEYKHRKPMFPEEERLFMVQNIKSVKEAYINEGRGVIDFLPTLDKVKPDFFVVNAEGGSAEKRQICAERGITYIELQRTPHEGLPARSSSSLKASLSQQSETAADGSSPSSTSSSLAGIPIRLDLAGTWIDQPCVSEHHPGWALTISLEPTFEIQERSGLSTSTRKIIQKIWPIKLPKMDPEMLARLVFCFENNPEREGGHISGAQDAIGICFPGLARHYYNGNFWPEQIEHTTDEMTLRFLEAHLVLIAMAPRRPGCNVTEGKEITLPNVSALAQAADACWQAIQQKKLEDFATAFKASFNAQIALFPGMVSPTVNGAPCPEASVQPYIDRYSRMDGVMAWKMAGAGGGGYLALVVNNAETFCLMHQEAIPIHVRRE
ncbi:MAG: adenylyltransferase/cytidyltransferase family protein [Bacteroides sp.]